MDPEPSPVGDDEQPSPPAPPPVLVPPSPAASIAIAGPVGSEEELLSVQQIALITRWLRHFSATAGLRSPARP
jgi:hypothetical protein